MIVIRCIFTNLYSLVESAKFANVKCEQNIAYGINNISFNLAVSQKTTQRYQQAYFTRSIDGEGGGGGGAHP